MKHFKKPGGSIHAFEDDGSQDDLITEDMVPLSVDEVLALFAPPVLTAEQQLFAYTDAVQTMLDAEARTRNYDGILSACTYATSTVERFKTEGQACVDWRDSVWSSCYAILDQVKTGARQQPTIPELLAEMPAMVWPTVTA